MVLAGSSCPANPAYWSGRVLGEATAHCGGKGMPGFHLFLLLLLVLQPCTCRWGQVQRSMMLRGMTDGERDLGAALPMPGRGAPPPMPGPHWAGAGMATAALSFGLHLSGMLQSWWWLFARIRSAHRGSHHPCLVLGTSPTSSCKGRGVHVQRASLLLSLATRIMSSQGIQSQMKQIIGSLFGLTGERD